MAAPLARPIHAEPDPAEATLTRDMTKDEFRAALFDLLHQAHDIPKADILDVLEAVCEITRDEIPDDDE